MKVYVAGGSGAIGMRLIPRLVSQGHEVTVTTRSEKKTRLVRELGAYSAVADALDRDSVVEAVVKAQPEIVIHQLTGWLGRLAAGEVGVSMMTQIRGTSNAKAKRKLGWTPSYPTYREGFRRGLGDVPITV